MMSFSLFFQSIFSLHCRMMSGPLCAVPVGGPGLPCGLSGRSSAAHGTSVGGPGPLMGPLWAVLGCLWGLCGRSWAALGPYVGGPGLPLGPLWSVLGCSWLQSGPFSNGNAIPRGSGPPRPAEACRGPHKHFFS